VCGTIEHHPENVGAEWVVIVVFGQSRLWFAYATEDLARLKMPDLVAGWHRALADGKDEPDDIGSISGYDTIKDLRRKGASHG
jgi:hypothetical protein